MNVICASAKPCSNVELGIGHGMEDEVREYGGCIERIKDLLEKLGNEMLVSGIGLPLEFDSFGCNQFVHL